ncbi:MAG: hypothetical protein GF364_09740 [Candidatus Lokiarchaeota archaeon]|nr:hypothetical protein [Candidatus Lokiarchaeota archaeon]
MSDTYIIHVIGYVGVGKSIFIRNNLSEHITFDIKEIYEYYGFKPKQLREIEKYSQFASAIHYTIGNLVQNIKDTGKETLIVESSGINQAINRAIIPFNTLIIWIQSNFYKKNESKRSYAKSLNKILERKFKENQIKYDIIFNVEEERFLTPIPEPYRRYFNQFS